jgi:hypothetical protein
MEFYVLDIGRSIKFIEGSGLNDWESISCHKNDGHRRAGKRITTLFLDIIEWCVVDFSRTMLSDVVITGHALHVMREAHLTGFEFRPTRIEGLSQTRSAAQPELWEFVVTGRGGPAHKDSGIVVLEKCESCGLIRYSAFNHGLQVDQSSYDGSDFFVLDEYPRHIIVSANAKTVIERSGLINVSFIESSELKWPTGVAIPR